MGAFNGNNKLKIFKGGAKVKKAYLGETKIYPAGNIVTYYVDSDEYYQEEVDEGASVLSPTTFNPWASGPYDWSFEGWSEDTAAWGEDILSSKVMGDEPITLYAVFAKIVNLSIYDSGRTYGGSGVAYYNNGNIQEGEITHWETPVRGLDFFVGYVRYGEGYAELSEVQELRSYDSSYEWYPEIPTVSTTEDMVCLYAVYSA